MIETIDIKINEIVLKQAPTLFVLTRIINDVNVVRDEIPDMEERKREIVAQWAGVTEKELDSNQYIFAYRELQTQIGSDPKKNLPAVEGMLKRGILQNRFPRINSAVDAANIISLTYLVPIGLFDFEKINGDIELSISADGDQFIPIGKDKPIKLLPGTAILKDEDGIFSAVGSRDSIRTMITPYSKKLLAFSWGIENIDYNLVSDALDRCAEDIARYSQ